MQCKKSTSTERKTVVVEDPRPTLPMLACLYLYVLLQASSSLVLWAGHASAVGRCYKYACRASSNLTLSARNPAHIPQDHPAKWTKTWWGTYFKSRFLNRSNTATKTHPKPNQKNPGTNSVIHTAESEGGQVNRSRPNDIVCLNC